MSDIKLFAVTGKPIFHSRSPQLFNTLFRMMKINAVYTRLEASSAEEAMKTANAIKLCGLNVTSPFKEDIILHLDRIDQHASRINAVNCIVKKGNKYIGYNTDFTGAIAALEKNGFSPKNKQAVVIGAGGAARAAAYGLIKSKAKKITLLNRTYDQAKKASLLLGCDAAPVEIREEILKSTDLVISCIPSYPNIIKPSFLKKNPMVLDANYKDPTFINDIKDKGFRAIHGLSWLYYQAIPAFHLFTGQKVSHDLNETLLDEIIIKKTMVKSNIALVGIMGAGKTAVGKSLAERKKFRFLDMDTLVEASAGMTIPEIFKSRGENTFREIEQSIISDHIPASKGNVFSLGGGAIMNEENRKILKHYCSIIWLWSSVQTAIQRIDISSRPLLNHGDPIMRAETFLKKRIPLYAKVSDIVINTETGTAEDIAKRIQNEMD